MPMLDDQIHATHGSAAFRAVPPARGGSRWADMIVLDERLGLLPGPVTVHRLPVIGCQFFETWLAGLAGRCRRAHLADPRSRSASKAEPGSRRCRSVLGQC
jgi:hypothetical protein